MTLGAESGGEPASRSPETPAGTRPSGESSQAWPWPDPDSVRPGPIVPTAGIFPDNETVITPAASGAAPAGDAIPGGFPLRPGDAGLPDHATSATPDYGTGTAKPAGSAGAEVHQTEAVSEIRSATQPSANVKSSAMSYPAPTPATPAPPPPPKAGAHGRWNTWIGFFFVTGITTLTAFGEIYLVGSVGWITGVVFVGVCALSALLMRRRDLATAVITPPLAFLIAVALSAQPAVIGVQGNLLLQESSAIITAIAFNAPWVFAGTGISLIIALIKGARFHRMDKARHIA